MNTTALDSDSAPYKRDPDLAAAQAAMKRAAAKARQRAKQVGGGVALWKNGQLVVESHGISTDQ